MYKILSIDDPQNTIDCLVYISNKFNLIYGEDLYYWDINQGKLKISPNRNYLIPFKYNKTIINFN